MRGREHYCLSRARRSWTLRVIRSLLVFGLLVFGLTESDLLRADLQMARVASSNNFPPVNVLDNNNNLTGFGVELSDAVFAEIGLRVSRRHSSSWVQVQDWLQSNSVDVIHDVGYLRERDETMDFSSPILEMRETIFVRNRQQGIDSLKDLDGKTVACVKNHISHLYLKNYPGIKCKIVDTPLAGLYELIRGEVDAYIYPDAIVYYYLQELGLERKVKVAGKSLRTLWWGMAVRSGNRELLERINQGIARTKDSGRYQEIYQKWFGRAPFSGYSREQYFSALGIAVAVTLPLGIIMALLFYNRRLRRARDELTEAIMELRRTRVDLNEASGQLQELAAMIPGALYQVVVKSDGSSQLTFITDGVTRLTGLPPATMIEQSELGRSAIYIDDQMLVEQTLLEHTRTGEDWSFDFRYTNVLTGKVSWARTTATAHTNEHGETVWNGILLDISELKSAQIKLKSAYDEMERIVERRTQQLYEANERLREEVRIRKQAEREATDNAQRTRAIVDSTLDAIITIDSQGIIQSANQTTVTMFGYEMNELLGSSIHIFMESDFAGHHDRFIKDYHDSGVSEIMRNSLEIKMVTKSGNKIPVEITVTEMSLDDGVNFVGVIKDIRERKRIEKMKDEFISSVSHELRTPLTSIQGALGIIKGGLVGEVPEEWSELLRIADNNSVRLGKLVNDILDIEKLELGKIRFTFNKEDIVEVVGRAIADNAMYADVHGVGVSFEPAVEHAMVNLDAERFGQALANLLSNAVKFSKTGTMVRVSVACIDEKVRISVSDKGPGISEAFRSRVFQKFAQADEVSASGIGGTGLGLSIVKAIVEKHGGQVGFDSEVGKGATFYIELKQVD